MKMKASLLENIEYLETKPKIQLLMDTAFSKEIRIVFKKNQVMKEHSAAFPIVVEVFDGEIRFGVENENIHLKKGDLITLESHVPHDLEAMEDSIVRLTLSKSDDIKRVENVINDEVKMK